MNATCCNQQLYCMHYINYITIHTMICHCRTILIVFLNDIATCHNSYKTDFFEKITSHKEMITMFTHYNLITIYINNQSPTEHQNQFLSKLINFPGVILKPLYWDKCFYMPLLSHT